MPQITAIKKTYLKTTYIKQSTNNKPRKFSPKAKSLLLAANKKSIVIF